jgi:hypothetical protein
MICKGMILTKTTNKVSQNSGPRFKLQCTLHEYKSTIPCCLKAGLTENRVELRKVFLLTLDSVSLFAIVLLIAVTSVSMYPSPSCFGTLGFGGLAGVGAVAFGAAGGGTT